MCRQVNLLCLWRDKATYLSRVELCVCVCDIECNQLSESSLVWTWMIKHQSGDSADMLGRCVVAATAPAAASVSCACTDSAKLAGLSVLCMVVQSFLQLPIKVDPLCFLSGCQCVCARAHNVTIWKVLSGDGIDSCTDDCHEPWHFLNCTRFIWRRSKNYTMK